ncbi:hypothetical protein THRCLA_09802, partial [Thraustotheca clavata]
MESGIDVISIKVSRSDIVWATLKEVCGIAYMLGSVGLSVYCVYALYPYLNNDFIWAGYASANVFTSLNNLYNMQLTQFITTTELNIFEPLNTLSIHDKIGVSSAYPRYIMYNDLSSLDAAVHGLRNIDIVDIVYMVTQYCWVDFDKRWAMAHTSMRQKRCWQRYQSNGAVYLETVLRNIDFQAWSDTTQGLFDARIAAGVLENPTGAAFLQYLNQHILLPVDNEVEFLQLKGVHNFILQYSNQYQIGIHETIDIENAMGVTWSLPIKSVATWHRGTLWTTKYMYSGLQFDLYTPTGNMSLVQNASTFFGLKNDNMMEETSVMFPLTSQLKAVHNHIGPFVTIDLFLLPPPPELFQIIQRFRSIVQTTLKTTTEFGIELMAMGTYELHPTPPPWQKQSLTFYGGSPMCGFGTGFSFVQESFGFDDACASQQALTIELNPYSSLFAYSLTQATSATACQLVPLSEVALCQNAFLSFKALSAMVPELSTIKTPKSVERLNLSYMQLISNGSNRNITLDSQPLLQPGFSFFGWMAIYDWAWNLREAVSFEGDNGTYALMSYSTPLVASTQLAATSGLVGVAIVSFTFWVLYCPMGCPWFVFN